MAAPVPAAETIYNVHTPVIHIEVGEMSQVADQCCIKSLECGYPLTVTAEWFTMYRVALPLPDYIVWNPTDSRLEI